MVTMASLILYSRTFSNRPLQWWLFHKVQAPMISRYKMLTNKISETLLFYLLQLMPCKQGNLNSFYRLVWPRSLDQIAAPGSSSLHLENTVWILWRPVLLTARVLRHGLAIAWSRFWVFQLRQQLVITCKVVLFAQVSLTTTNWPSDVSPWLFYFHSRVNWQVRFQDLLGSLKGMSRRMLNCFNEQW